MPASKNLAGRNPDDLISIPETYEFLGFSRAKYYRRCGSIPRFGIGDGTKVGHRIGDVLQFKENEGNFLPSGGGNFSLIKSGTRTHQAFFDVVRLNIFKVVPQPISGTVGETVIYLPPAAQWGNRSTPLTIIDFVGADKFPIRIIAAEDELIGLEREYRITTKHGSVRLITLLSNDEFADQYAGGESDGWWAV
jgi:hypothetical protein